MTIKEIVTKYIDTYCRHELGATWVDDMVKDLIMNQIDTQITMLESIKEGMGEDK